MKAAAVALLTGGFARQNLVDAGAYRVYEDLIELSNSLEELGITVRTGARQRRKSHLQSR